MSRFAKNNVLSNAGLFLFLLPCLAAYSMPAIANQYDLEMVIFLNNKVRSTELARPESDRNAGLDRRLGKLFQRTGATVALPATVGNLSELAENLRLSPDYEVLQHTTWRQEVELISQAPYVDVSALSLGEESGLKGLVRFYHSPLLYVDVFLKYTPFVDSFSQPITADPGASFSGVAPSEAFFLVEKRRLRLKELHYLDNPRIGAIISVWPIEEEEGE